MNGLLANSLFFRITELSQIRMFQCISNSNSFMGVEL